MRVTDFLFKGRDPQDPQGSCNPQEELKIHTGRITYLFGLWRRIVGLRLPLGRRLLVVLEDFVDGGTAVGQLCVALQPSALPKQARHFVRDILLEVVEDGELRHGADRYRAGVVRHDDGRVLEVVQEQELWSDMIKSRNTCASVSKCFPKWSEKPRCVCKHQW